MNLKLLSKLSGIPLRHSNASFDNYVVNPENKNHFNICKNWDGQESIFLTGNTGTGKTHLAISMLKNMPMVKLSQKEIENEKYKYEYYAERERDLKEKERLNKILELGLYAFRPAICLFVPIVEMFIELNEAAQKEEGKKSLLDLYSNGYDCICFDDFGAEKLTDAKRENFYYIIDRRYRNMKATIVTSNFTIKEINEVEPRIASRFAEMGKILQFEGTDFRKKPKS